MMSATTEQLSEDSPKRRSTFYVSLESSSSNSDPRQSSKFQKSSSCDSEKYACSTFPITQSKTAPNVPSLLSRTQSTNNESRGYTSGKRLDSSMLEPRGKVQSLTRIFETPKNNNNNNNKSTSNNNNNLAVETEQRQKKVERTRSFKTIERFQNRFVGKKESTSSSGSGGSNSRKDGRLNKSIAAPTGFEQDKNNLEKEEMENNKRKSKHEESKKVVVEKRSSVVVVTQPKIATAKARTRDQAKSVVEQRSTGKQTQSGNASLANLLIRRTHSTKLARSTSALVKSGRHASIDNCNTSVTSVKVKNDDADSGQENDEPMLDETVLRNETRFEETDTDAGVHSGECLFCIYNLFLWVGFFFFSSMIKRMDMVFFSFPRERLVFIFTYKLLSIVLRNVFAIISSLRKKKIIFSLAPINSLVICASPLTNHYIYSPLIQH